MGLQQMEVWLAYEAWDIEMLQHGGAHEKVMTSYCSSGSRPGCEVFVAENREQEPQRMWSRTG